MMVAELRKALENVPDNIPVIVLHSEDRADVMPYEHFFKAYLQDIFVVTYKATHSGWETTYHSYLSSLNTSDDVKREWETNLSSPDRYGWRNTLLTIEKEKRFCIELQK